MRHIAKIMLPTDSQGTVGERQGADPTYISDWPFSFKQLNGSIASEVHSNFGNTAGQIEGYADPSRQVTPGMYLTGGTLGDRKLNIEAVNDNGGIVGGKLTLTYTEAIGG